MAEFVIHFSVENAYQVTIEADSAVEAHEKFESMYEQDFEEMEGSEFVETDHTVNHINERKAS